MEAEPTVSDPSEAPRRRRRPAPPPPPPAQGNVVKGAILVVVAVIIGVALLRDDSSTSAQVSVGAESPVTTPEGDGNGDGDNSSTTVPTTVATRAPSEVKVLVANGSDVNGAAGVQTNALKALGYVTGNPGNAARVPATVVYYTAGYEAEAAELAAAIGAPETSVQPMPTPAPVDDLALSNILVVIGPDLAKAG